MINRILIYNSGGGIGDALQILPLINAANIEAKKYESKADDAGEATCPPVRRVVQ